MKATTPIFCLLALLAENDAADARLKLTIGGQDRHVLFSSRYLSGECSANQCTAPTISSPVTPAVAPPVTAPVTPPVPPPVTQPVTPPVSPPAKSPVTSPVSPPVKPPVASPVAPPVTAPVTPPVSPPVKPPVTPPVSPPVAPPVTAPVSPPVKPPVSAPVSPPVTTPVTPPVSPPVKAPVTPPVAPPVTPPVSPPVAPPVTSPVSPPVKPPVSAPVSPPTAATLPAPACPYSCEWPAGTSSYAVITKGNAVIGAHNIYYGVAVGGTLSDGTPSESAVFDKTRSYVKTLATPNAFNFNGGITQNSDLSNRFDFAHFEWLAKHATNYQSGSKKVVVVTSGGTYNMYNFNNGGQGYDNGNTLVVFNTTADITITKTSDGRQFGPSILAPFSKVTVLGDAGFVDGIIIAREVVTSGSNQGQLQLHGAIYNGCLTCDCPGGSASTTTSGAATAPVAPAPVSSPVTPPVSPPVSLPVSPPVKPPVAPPVSPPVAPPAQPACVAMYGDCTQGQACCAPSTCKYKNKWYSQCL